MTKRLHCSKCGKPTDALYSPDWVCKDCVSKDQKRMYPHWEKQKSKEK